MRKIFTLFICMASMQLSAQEEQIRISFNDGMPVHLNVSDVKDITFVEDTNPLTDLAGEWFNVGDDGPFESFDFYEDGTLTYYGYYKGLGAIGPFGGSYWYEDYVLKTFSGDYHITDHSDTFLTLMGASVNSSFRYYKVQKTYSMNTYDSPISIGNEGDSIFYVDSVVIGLENGKITALQRGQGYALVKDAKLNTTVAYRVDVAYQAGVPATIDWTQYFGKTQDEIIAEFGTPDATYSDSDLLVYTNGYNPEISQLWFYFDTETGKVYYINVCFRGDKEEETYENEIINNYQLLSNDSYYGIDENGFPTVMISITKTPIMCISYFDYSGSGE